MQKKRTENSLDALLVASGINSILNILALAMLIYAFSNNDISFPVYIFLVWLILCVIFAVILRIQASKLTSEPALPFFANFYLVLSGVVLLMSALFYGALVAAMLLPLAVIMFSLAGIAIIITVINYFLPFCIFVSGVSQRKQLYM